MSLDAPTEGQYEPTVQLVHAAALERPVCALYVPAAQAYTTPSPGQKCPAAQAAAVHDDAPGALCVPAAHAVHDVASGLERW